MYKVKYVPDKNHCFRICIELTHKYPENWCRIERENFRAFHNNDGAEQEFAL